MLSVETSDAWTSASVALTVGAATETYNHAGHGSAYDLADDFVTWANDAARAWAGAVLVTWTWAKATNTGAALSFTISGVASATWTPNATWITLTSMGVVAAATWSATDGAVGTTCPFRGLTVPSGQGSGHWTVRRDYRFSGDSGDASATTAARPGVPGLFGLAPSVGALGDTLDAARVQDVLKSVANPRRLAVYNVERKKWHKLAFADFVVEPIGPKIFGFTVTAGGQAL